MNEYRDKCHIIEQEVDGIGPWLWPLEDWEGFRWSSEDWVTSKEDWLKHVKHKGVCVQAGGLCGMYPRLLSEHFEVVYTFEPDGLSYYCLVNNCQVDNIIKSQAALGKSSGMVHTLVGPGGPTNRGMNRVIEAVDGKISYLKVLK